MDTLVIFPVGRHQARFELSVLRGVDLGAVDLPQGSAAVVSDLSGGDGPLRLWPIRDGPRNRKVWEQLKPGTWAVFVQGTSIVAAARVRATADSGALAPVLVPGPSRGGGSLLVSLRDLREVDLPSSRFADQTGVGTVRRQISLHHLEGPLDSLCADLSTEALRESDEEARDGAEAGHRDPGLPVSEPEALFQDEMTPWYRQGLIGRHAALRAARQSLEKGEPGADDSIRRVVRSLAGSKMEVRFPAVGELARQVLAVADVDLLTTTNQLLGALDEETAVRDPDPVRIMVVEDDPVQALLVREVLAGPNRQVFQAGSVELAEEMLAQQDISLIVLDLGMPGADGRDLLTQLRESPRTSGTPIIMLSGKTGAQPKTECLALGADAFYEKSVHPATLASAVSGLLERSAESRYLAHRDALTGLPNRSLFLESAERARLAALRRGDELTLVFVSLDEASRLGEEWGAAARDRVMKLLAATLSYTVRRTDLLTRWGQDDFALLLGGVGPSQAANIVNKILDAVSSVTMPESPEVRITCSIGSATLEPGDGIEDAAARASHRLHVAKRGGGGASVSDQQEVLPTMRQVILIEDDDIVADLVSHRLERAGYRVTRFADGGEAMGAVDKALPTVVIVDTTLPGASGFEILHRLRLKAHFAPVPIMVLTSGNPADASRALELGANDALSKPFDSGEFMARVESLVKGRAGWRLA